MKLLSSILLAVALFASPALAISTADGVTDPAVSASCSKPLSQLVEIVKNSEGYVLNTLTAAQISHLKEAAPPPEPYDELLMLTNSDLGGGQILVIHEGCIAAQTPVMPIQQLNSLIGAGNASD